MPGGDRSGPEGLGPMTGRGAGLCAGFAVGGYANQAFRFGFGRGLGGGRNFRGGGFGRGRRGRWSWPDAYRTPDRRVLGSFSENVPVQAPAHRESNKQLLENQLEALQSQMASIQAQLAELESDSRSERESS